MGLIQPIHAVDDPALSDYRDLTDVSLRRRVEPAGGFFMAESEKVIARAIHAGYQARSVLTSERWLPALLEILPDQVPILLADDEVIRQVTGYRVHRGALAAMHRRPLPSLQEVLGGARRIVVLEAIVDHTNVGAAFRSVAALGFDGVVVDPTCADPLYRRSVRVSMGAVFTLPWTRAGEWPQALIDIRASGFTTIALTPGSSAQPLAEVAAASSDKVALLLGAEGHGLSAAALASTDLAVRIPMSGDVDSLNIAAATAVACYAFTAGAAAAGGSTAQEVSG